MPKKKQKIITREIVPLKSQKMTNLINNYIKENYKTTPSRNEINEIKDALHSYTQEYMKTYTLNLRVAEYKGNFYIDMTNKAGQAIVMSKNGWDIINEPPTIMFRKNKNQLPIIKPSPAGIGNAKLLLKYVNLPEGDKKTEIMYLTTAITTWVPNIDSMGNNIWGVEGSQKTSTMQYTKRVFDPSIMEIMRLPKDVDELKRQLNDNYLIPYDNISYLSQSHSDEICSAMTGIASDKRKLYTDEETIVKAYKRKFMMNGIVQAAIYPDLAQRFNSIEVAPATTLKKKTDMDKEFKKDLPDIIGGISDTICRAIEIYPTLEGKIYLHRMADFSQWGCAIAIALGYTKEDFETALKNKDTEQITDSLNNNPLASVIMEL